LKSGYGHMIFGLNIPNMHGLGIEFDPRLGGWEDDEIERQSIAAGIPWYIYAGARGACLPPRNKGRAGGIQSLPAKRALIEARAKKIIRDRWPAYMSGPGKPWRCQWAKMIRDHIGELPRPLFNISAGSKPFAWRDGGR
jgi:hypothetical protein